MRSKSGTSTKYPGVKKLGMKQYQVRAKAKDPRTGNYKEVVETYDNVTAPEAARRRQELLRELRAGRRQVVEQVRVGEFAQSWMRSKALKLSRKSARTYSDALEQHILPALGDVYYHALTPDDVQEWVGDCLLAQWRTGSGERRRYSPRSVHVWFRVLRTMTKKAVWQLRLPLDPTLHVDFPEFDESVVSRALTSEALCAFLEAMQRLYPQHYALTVTLAFTGMRFGHACALRWEDWDEERQLVRVERKHVFGETAPVSRRKQAPAEIPVEPDLAEVLRWHRHRLLAEQAPGLAEGWMFPAANGAVRTPSSLQKAWRGCLAEAGPLLQSERFTVHGLRYTFTDLTRRAKVDAVIRRALTGHVTPQMQRHYSSIGLDEKRAAIANVHSLIPLPRRRNKGGPLMQH